MTTTPYPSVTPGAAWQDITKGVINICSKQISHILWDINRPACNELRRKLEADRLVKLAERVAYYTDLLAKDEANRAENGI